MLKNNSINRKNYLNASAAVVPPLAAIALWIAVWEKQTGKKVDMGNSDYMSNDLVTLHAKNFENAVMSYEAAKSFGIADEDIEFNTEINYETLSHSYWTPTIGDVPIPAGYGSAALKLFVFPDVVSQSFVHATKDHREGWEWGHTSVFSLVREDGMFKASTNTSRVSFPRDAVKLARSTSIEELANKLSLDTGHAPKVSLKERLRQLVS